MANCKNCGAEISPAAQVCPYCGMPQQVQADDPFDSTQAYIPKPGQPENGGYNGQPAGNGYNQPVNNYNNQPANSYNNQPVSNYNGQPGDGYNGQPGGGYNGQQGGYNGQPAGGYNMNPYGGGMEQKPAPMPIGGLIALSIVAILLCTIPGIVTLVKTLNINSALTYADQQARYASAKKWAIVTIIVGAVITVLSFIGGLAQSGAI
ncbi:MAG: zinc-ribbon domain-containing protein [Lachnospiraceae bacterium]|nr:zinc-ribbon domain-containing protein [Lachnospiraceae bacterium]